MPPGRLRPWVPRLKSTSRCLAGAGPRPRDARRWPRLTCVLPPLRWVPVEREGVIWASVPLSAAAARLLWSTSGPKVPAGACAGGSRLTPGGGQVMLHARGLLGVLWAAWLAISHRASLPRRRWGAASRAVATPLVAPGPAHAGSQVAPAQVDAFRAARAGMASRLCLRTDRLRAFGRSSPTAPRHPRSTLSAPPGHSPASCVHPSHRPHPTHRSRTRSPPSATHTHHLHASRPPYPVLSRRCSELPFDLDQGWIHISVMHVGM